MSDTIEPRSLVFPTPGRAEDAEALVESRAAGWTRQDGALLELAATLLAGGYRFTTPTPATHERVNERPGNEWARDLAGVFGWSRPFHEKLLPPEIFRLMQRAGVIEGHAEGWRSLVRFSTLNGQGFLHSAYPTTGVDSVFFGPDSFRFAALRQYLSDSADFQRAVDIGSGAGPGAITLALARPQAEVTGVDINPQALRLTRINAALAGASNLQVRRSDLLSQLDGGFDLIVANPPYLLDPGARAYRHGGGAMGSHLSLAIVEAAVNRLVPGGSLVLYTGAAIVGGEDRFRLAAVSRLQAAGFRCDYREVDPDVFGEELSQEPYAEVDRIAAVVLVAARQEASGP